MSAKNHGSAIDLNIFRRIVDLSPSPTFITNKPGFIIYVNDEFCRVSGYNRHEIIGRQPNILKSGEHTDSFYKTLWETILAGKTWKGEICNKAKNGKLYWEKEIIIPINGNTGEIEYFISIRIDDMDRRRADMLQHIQELSGGIAHEFAQPLQVLTIMSSLLESQPGRKEYIELLQSSVDRITRLVHSLKNINSLQNREYFSERILDIEASSQKSVVPSKVLRILIVDDEKELREILTEGLRMEGFECQGVGDAYKALELLDSNDYDLILSDINMPGMNGIELFRQIKSRGYNGNFMFMTGYSIDQTMKTVIQQTDGMIHKPFQLDDLIRSINKLFAPD